MKELIVTFSCSNNVHVYNENSSVKPMFPYKVHTTVEDAIKHLKEKRNIVDTKIITN